MTNLHFWAKELSILKGRPQGMVMTKESYAGDGPLYKSQDGYNEKQDNR